MQTFKLTPDSAALYIKMIKEADYENADGFNYALMDFTKAERGNLSDLKKKGLVDTWNDSDVPGYLWVEFTNIEFAEMMQTALKG